MSNTNYRVDTETLADMIERASGFYTVAVGKTLAAAKQVQAEGKGFGDRKVFIADIAAQMNVRPSWLANMLVHWNCLGWVSLTRADLVGAMPADKVAASEIISDNATFHFVVVS